MKREEAIKGQGRVKYRKEQLLNKLSQQKEVLKQKAKEEEEREERLTALRNQVRSNTIQLEIFKGVLKLFHGYRLNNYYL